MRLFFGTATLAVAGLFLMNATLFAAPSRAQTLAQAPTAQILPTETQSIVTPQVAVDLPSPQAEAEPTPPSSLPELVAAHMDTQAADDEQKCLAVAVYFEAKGEPLSGQLAVAQVLLNRTKSGRFPETICGVVKQPKQFSFVRHGTFPSFPTGCKAWRTALAISQIALGDMWQPMVGHAMFFHAKRVSPHWHATEVASLGNHIFYR